jgi:hypothetical protein
VPVGSRWPPERPGWADLLVGVARARLGAGVDLARGALRQRRAAQVGRRLPVEGTAQVGRRLPVEGMVR